MVEPTWKLPEHFPFNEVQEAFLLDALESSHPVHMVVDDPDVVEEIIDSLTFIKGASVFRMLNHSIGESSFRGGLTLYLKDFSNSTADKDDLWQSWTTQAHLDGTLPSNMTVKDVMDSWLLQTGFPVVTVVRDYESGMTSFTQERFLLYGERNRTRSDYSPKWWVPISYTTQDSPDFTNTRPSFWLNPNEEKAHAVPLSTGEKWILLNIQEAGYYRVNYDAKNWQFLTEQLKSQASTGQQVIPPSAKSQLLDDAFNLARSGQLPYSTALNMALTLKNDTDYLPWASTFRVMSFMDEMLTNSPIYENFKEFMVGLSRKLVESVGWEDPDEESDHVRSLTRDLALRWSCLWGNEICIDEAKKRFSQWMKSYETGNDYRISPDLQEIVYCNGLRYGSTSEWEFIWQRYLDSNPGEERDRLLDSLDCTREIPLLEKNLGLMLNMTGGISKSDWRVVYNPMANNPLGSSLLFNFLRNNWGDIRKSKGSDLPELTEMVVASIKYMSTPEQLAQLKQFWMDHHESFGLMKTVFKQAIAEVEANLEWMERSYEEVKVWLESQR